LLCNFQREAGSKLQAQRGETRKKAERQRFFPTMAAGAVMMGGLDDDGLSFAFAPVPSGTIGSSSNPCNGNLAIKIISPGAHPTRAKAFRERFFASEQRGGGLVAATRKVSVRGAAHRGKTRREVLQSSRSFAIALQNIQTNGYALRDLPQGRESR